MRMPSLFPPTLLRARLGLAFGWAGLAFGLWAAWTAAPDLASLPALSVFVFCLGWGLRGGADGFRDGLAIALAVLGVPFLAFGAGALVLGMPGAAVATLAMAGLPFLLLKRIPGSAVAAWLRAHLTGRCDAAMIATTLIEATHDARALLPGGPADAIQVGWLARPTLFAHGGPMDVLVHAPGADPLWINAMAHAVAQRMDAQIGRRAVDARMVLVVRPETGHQRLARAARASFGGKMSHIKNEASLFLQS